MNDSKFFYIAVTIINPAIMNAAIMNADIMDAGIDAAITPPPPSTAPSAINNVIDSASTTAISTIVKTIETAINTSNDKRDNIKGIRDTLTYISGIHLCRAALVLEV